VPYFSADLSAILAKQISYFCPHFSSSSLTWGCPLFRKINNSKWRPSGQNHQKSSL